MPSPKPHRDKALFERWNEHGESVADLAKMWGISHHRTREILREQRELRGLHEHSRKGRRVEDVNPEVGAAAIVASQDPIRSFEGAAESEGMPKHLVKKVGERLEKEFPATATKVKEVRTAHLLGLVETNAERVLNAVTDQDIEEASLRDKAVAASIFIQNRQLLRGEPTEILSVQQRSQLDELLGAVFTEAMRRGMTIEMGDGEGAPALVGGREPENLVQRRYERAKQRHEKGHSTRGGLR